MLPVGAFRCIAPIPPTHGGGDLGRLTASEPRAKLAQWREECDREMIALNGWICQTGVGTDATSCATLDSRWSGSFARHRAPARRNCSRSACLRPGRPMTATRRGGQSKSSARRASLMIRGEACASRRPELRDTP
jgi:hypothetical protein